MKYIFDESLETKIPLIDKEHAMLVDYLNDLVDAIENNKGKEEVVRTAEFLSMYTVKHFNDEEKIQIEYNYPEYHYHKSLHENFKGKVIMLLEELGNDGPSEFFVKQVNTIVGNWLINHIKIEDLKIANYIRSLEGK
jgi:hemerythrin